MRTDWVAKRAGDGNKTQMHYARNGVVTEEMAYVATRERVLPELVRAEVARGRMVIPANVQHTNLEPMGIGVALACKVNANIGNSAVTSDIDGELRKLKVALKHGADTVMDLSTGGDIDRIRAEILRSSPVPIGTVPVYQVLSARKKVSDISADDLLDMLEHQAKQGVDYFTIHAGVLAEHLPLVNHRITGIVSRGGSMMAQWMIEKKKQNPFFTHWDKVLEICARYDVTISAGDGLRPGCLADASDAAQFAELKTMGELTVRAWEKDVQVMIEGPGHVPFDQIEMNVKKEMDPACHEAPLLCSRPARHRHRARVRPHHERHRRHDGRHRGRRDALLRDPEVAPGPPGRGRRSPGPQRVQDRRPRGRHRAPPPRCPRPRRRALACALRVRLEGSSSAFSLDPGDGAVEMHDATLPDDYFKKRRVLLDVRPEVLQHAHQPRRRGVQQAGRRGQEVRQAHARPLHAVSAP